MMDNPQFLKKQRVEINRLIDAAGDDPFVRVQFTDRLDEIDAQLATLSRDADLPLIPSEGVTLPRTAFFLRGEGVVGTAGINPTLAGRALIQYEKMYVEQAKHDERAAARIDGLQRRPRGSAAPALMLTGTPRGSFGFEFCAAGEEDAITELHAQSLANVADALAAIGSAGDDLESAIAHIPTAVVKPMRQFFKTLARNGAELRLAFPSGYSKRVSPLEIVDAASRLERDVRQNRVSIEGELRGVLLDSYKFDLRGNDGATITGTISDSLEDDDLTNLVGLIRQQCRFVLLETSVSKPGASAKKRFELLRAERSQALPNPVDPA